MVRSVFNFDDELKTFIFYRTSNLIYCTSKNLACAIINGLERFFNKTLEISKQDLIIELLISNQELYETIFEESDLFNCSKRRQDDGEIQQRS